MQILKSLVLADGTQIMFESDNYTSSDCSIKEEGICAYIVADINGAKKPNIIGRDLFRFVIKEQGIYPEDYDKAAENICTNETSDWGWGCASKIFRENAINY